MSDYFKLPGYYNTDWSRWGTSESYNAILGQNDSRAGRDNMYAWSAFDRFYSVNLQGDEMSNKHYIFMCRPDLYIFDEYLQNKDRIGLSYESRVAYDPFFQYLGTFYPNLLASLSLWFDGAGTSSYTDGLSDVHSFIPYITGRVESIQLPDYSIKTNNLVQPYSKYSIPYTVSANESVTGGTFDITFREDGQYSIHKLFYAWILYMNNVMKNLFIPKEKYILDNLLDYATSVYDIVVDNTGENILYWAKYTGVVPTSVPLSNLSFNRGGTPADKISIPFSYFYIEHMSVEALLDFNYNSLGERYMNRLSDREKLSPPLNTVPIYDSVNFVGRNLVGRPIIYATRCPVTNNPLYKLKFVD